MLLCLPDSVAFYLQYLKCMGLHQAFTTQWCAHRTLKRKLYLNRHRSCNFPDHTFTNLDVLKIKGATNTSKKERKTLKTNIRGEYVPVIRTDLRKYFRCNLGPSLTIHGWSAAKFDVCSDCPTRTHFDWNVKHFKRHT